MEASVDPQPRGPDWMPITPKTGSLFHAETHLDEPNTKRMPSAPPSRGSLDIKNVLDAVFAFA